MEVQTREDRGARHPQDASKLLKRFEGDLSASDLRSGIKAAIVHHGRSDPERLNERKHAAWSDFIRYRGKRYERCNFGNYEATTDQQKSACQQVSDVAEGEPLRNLILLGRAGTGKDHLLAAGVRLAISNGVFSIAWTSGPSLFSELRSAIAEKRKEQEILAPYMRSRLLVFSDMAMTTLSDYQREIVYKIVDERYNNMLTTWVSSNVADRSAFEKATSGQIVDRLADGAVYVPCNWESYRKLKQSSDVP